MAMRVYQNLGRNILQMTAVSTLFCLAAFAFVFFYALPGLTTTQAGDNINAQVGEAFVTLLMAVGIGAPLLVFGVTYSSLVIVQLVSDFMLGNIPNAQTIRETARRILPRMFGVVFFETILCFGALILSGLFMMMSAMVATNTEESNLTAGFISLLTIFALIIGLLALPFVAGRHALTIPIAVMEGLSPWKASKRSVQLMKGSAYVPSGYNTILPLYILMSFLLLILFLGYSALASLVPAGEAFLNAEAGSAVGAVFSQATGLIPLYLALWTLIPVWCTTTTVLYYERRIRWEGFDIEALAQDVWRADRRSRFEL
ncbi:MAG: hypothetical protein KF784_06740 [Fimbriimonadaceae bacterium]|nr:hypothetical protein [Fimbriimonadaceae bacterium]